MIEYQLLLGKQVYLLSDFDAFIKRCIVWIKNFIYLKEISSRRDSLPSLRLLLKGLEIKLSIEHNGIRKSVFLHESTVGSRLFNKR